MKTIIFLFLISCSYDVAAQKEIFVRVYNLSDKKIYKGSILSVTDSSLSLRHERKVTVINVKQIGSIKTKHSAGNNVLAGATVGAVSLGLVGALSADNQDDGFIVFTPAESAVIGVIAGAIDGALVGSITILFKHSKTFVINGDAGKWKTFTSQMAISHK